MRKICVYIGSRANYSSLKAVMTAIQEHKQLQLQVALGAAAVLDRFGNMEGVLKQDGFEISAKFYSIVDGQNPITMAQSTGLGIIELSQAFDNLKPDMILVVGDRFDVMAPVIAASYMNIPIAHTMGGEVSGTIDESIRHAITKMAHLHFPANQDAADRIIKMGEAPERVFNFGCPRIDLVREILHNHMNGDRIDQNAFFEKYRGVGGQFDIEEKNFLLVSQHPVTTEYGQNRRSIEATLNALNQLKLPTIMLWPNVDAGSDEISKGIRTFREQHQPDWLHLFINLPIDTYVKLMDMCACLIGNSSSALREGAYIGVPAVDLGTRQNTRMRARNVLNADNDADEIVAAVNKHLENGRYESETIYGDGTAGRKIADVLASSDLDETSLQKLITY